MTLLSCIWEKTPWMEEAACLGYPPEIFFPPNGVSKRAKDICLSCPVMEECQEYGLDEEYGIWGALGPSDRKAIGRGKGRESPFWPGFPEWTARLNATLESQPITAQEAV